VSDLIDNLVEISSIKEELKTAINSKGGTLDSEPFSDYPAAIDDLSTSGGVEWSESYWQGIYDESLTKPDIVATIPDFVEGTEVIYFVVNIIDVSDGNSITLNNIAGDYTVDWGDGSATEDYAANTTTATHSYNFTTLTSDLTSEGYKQALITITPQVSNNITSFSYNTGTISKYAVNWYGVQQAAVGENNISDFTEMFYYCYSLTTIPELDTSSGTNFGSMFYYCYSLTTIPELDTSSGTDFSNMFYGCYSLQTIPLLDTSSGENFSNMFQSCSSLTTIPALNTSIGENFSYMFSSCHSLTAIPELDTSGYVLWLLFITNHTITRYQ